jgi:hypothetical protein
MTRIVDWNIENFTYVNQNAKVIVEGNDIQQYVDRMEYILKTFFPEDKPDIHPDIFVILEVKPALAGTNAPGTLLEDADAVTAVRGLLLLLRRIAESWCLIPPLKSGGNNYREAIAVYYNSAKLNFTGPYIYGKGQYNGETVDKSIAMNSGSIPIPYPDSFWLF